MICGARFEQGVIPVPTAYTVASIEADDVPEPVCDDCIEQHYLAEVSRDLLADRQRFHRGQP